MYKDRQRKKKDCSNLSMFDALVFVCSKRCFFRPAHCHLFANSILIVRLYGFCFSHSADTHTYARRRGIDVDVCLCRIAHNEKIYQKPPYQR